ncbi:MAG: hypothetical protein RBS05_18835 [Zoogloea oleivorans]|jgi:hypothetical protein|uniref:hypothetical protein n=1 Tax=Zoogloea oleivorans TaxID=1552750 RepID=UPI002A366C2B|nr:hypothetical protein [Zoogloea oleivorans]MDY0037972.1 hypothetical protein [Zoogloea oleivorans]
MLDFNQDEIQGAVGAGPIPEDSIVQLRMSIRPPRTGKEGNEHGLFCRSAKGNEYIDVEFECPEGSAFAGRKIWEMFTLAGREEAVKISRRTLRAILESARGISPSDMSPQATEARKISDWADFNGMAFLAQVGIVVEQSTKDGRWYANNTIKKVITKDDGDAYSGEKISDKPLPTLPDATATQPAAPAPAANAPAWGQTQAAAPASVAPAVAAAPAQKPPMPAWATR